MTSHLGPEARYDARESIALSFVAGLQRLPTQQRAALVLRDVLGFSASEVAEMLESTPASVNSALQRARARVEHLGGVPDHVPRVRSEYEAKAVDRFVDSFQQGDLEGVIALLSDDARFTMPPDPFELRGPRVIAEYLHSRGFWGQDLKLVPTRANSQPAYRLLPPRPERKRPSGQRAHGIDRACRADFSDNPIRRQKPARPFRTATHRTQ